MSEIENIEKLMSEKNVEFRNFKLTAIEARKNENDKEELVLEGIPCVFDKETILYKGQYYESRETIDKDAFNEADMSDVIFNFNHCGRVYARTRNKSLALEVKPDGLHMRATLMKDDEGHAQLYRDIKSGLIDKMSFAFTVDEQDVTWTEQTDGPDICHRTVKRIGKLYDVSAVDIPAYDETSISARNVFEAESQERKAESEKRANDIALAKARYNYINI